MKRNMAAVVMISILFFLPYRVFAEDQSVIVYAVEQGKPVAVSLVEKADYVAFAITITSRQEEPENEINEISEARQRLMKEAKKNQKIRIHQGPIYLSSTSNSRTSFSYGPSQMTVHLLIPLSETDGDVFKAAGIITDLVERIEPPEMASYSLSPMKIAVENPGKYRSKLLGMLDEHIEEMRKLLKKTGKFFISGIERPVMVRQFDLNQVEIFLDYKLSVEVEGE